jgi:hypothetical protein
VPFTVPLAAPARKSGIPMPMVLGAAVLIAAVAGAAVLGGFVPGLNSRSSAGPSSIAGGSPAVSQTASASATAKATPKASPLSAPGEFGLTGSLMVPREEHTSTLLKDGRILIVGGWDNNGDNLSSAEVYDPASGKFTATGSMTVTRWDHSATLLPDGRVLIAGGATDGSSSTAKNVRIASTEIFDPASSQFEAGPDMSQDRSCATASLLSGGRVLIAGGVNSARDQLASAEILDLNTGKFTATGSLLKPTACHTATLMPDGRVFVAGGWTGHVLTTVEIYQP